MSRNLLLLGRILVIVLAAVVLVALLGFGAGIPEMTVVAAVCLVGVTTTMRRHRVAA